MERTFKIMDKDYDLDGIKSLLTEVYNANGNNYGQAALGMANLLQKDDLVKLVLSLAEEFMEISSRTIDNDPMAAYMRKLTGAKEGGFDYMSSREKMCCVCLNFFEGEKVNGDVVNAVNTVGKVFFADADEPNKDTDLTQSEVSTYIQAPNHRFPGDTLYKKMLNNENGGSELIIPFIRLSVCVRILANLSIYTENQDFVNALQNTLK